MGSWNNENVCINAPADKLYIVEQVCECLGIDKDEYFDMYMSKSHDADCSVSYFGLDWDFRGGASDIHGYDIFPILNKLIGYIQVCDVEDNGSSIDDSVYIDATMLDSAAKKKTYETIEYSEGEQTVGGDYKNVHDCMPWEELKEKIEQQANDRGIEVAWIEDGDRIIPDEDEYDFYDLCETVFEENFSYWDAGKTSGESDLSDEDYIIDQEILSRLEKKAAEKNYTELSNLLKDIRLG